MNETASEVQPYSSAFRRKADSQTEFSRDESITARIAALKEDPRPPGCRKLQGMEGWRMRVGRYRVVYEIDDSQKTVTVLKVAHRKDVYR